MLKVLTYNNEPLFLARDVGLCLGMADATIRDHVTSMNDGQSIKLTNAMLSVKAGLTNFRKLHNTGENFLTEKGVYKLILKSRKPSAEKFQDWVCDEVLPSIRKTGQYIINNSEQSSSPTVYKLSSELFESTLSIAKLMKIPDHIAIIETNKKVRKDTGVDYSSLLAHSPLLDNIQPKDIMLEPTEIGKSLPEQISAIKVNKVLCAAGLQEKNNGEWKPTEIGKLFCTQHAWDRGSKSGYNLKWSKEKCLKIFKKK